MHNYSKYGKHPPDAQTGMLIVQKNYGNVYSKDIEGNVKQTYPDINEENDNEAQGLKCFRFLGIDDKELNRLFQLNRDLDTYNVKIKDFNTVDTEVKKMLRQNPDKKILQFSITAGHGMCKEGHQWMLVNEI